MSRVALIMPVLNEEAAVDETMAAILASTRVPDEIVIGDGGSTDRTVEKILSYRERGLNVKVVPNPARLPGGGRNAAAGATDCEILLFCDFGNRIDPHWVERIVARFDEEPPVDLVFGVYYPLVKSDFEHCVACINYPAMRAVERMSIAERRHALPPAAMGGGSNAGCTRAVWRQAGGFPEWLRAAEDTLFIRKLRKIGALFDLVPDAVVSHHMRSDVHSIFRQYFTYHRGSGRTRFVSRHLLRPALIYGGLLAAAAASPTMPWLGAVAVLAYVAYVYRAGLGKIIKFDGRLAKAVYVPQAAGILLARDCGALLGCAAGIADWMLKPIYRRNYYAYAADGPTGEHRLVTMTKSTTAGGGIHDRRSESA